MSPSIYDRNWPMDAIFSTVMQNYNKKIKSGKKKSSEEEEANHEEHPFAISLPGGKVLGIMTQQSDSDTEVMDSSSRAADHRSGKSSNRHAGTSSSTHPPSSTRNQTSTSSSADAPPSASRSKPPKLGFTLIQDRPPKPTKEKVAKQTSKKRSAPASRTEKEVDRDADSDVSMR